MEKKELKEAQRQERKNDVSKEARIGGEGRGKGKREGIVREKRRE